MSVMVRRLVIVALAVTSTLGDTTINYAHVSSVDRNSRTVNVTSSFLTQNYTAAPSPCGGTLYGSGYIRSPNYPANYDNNLRCNWTLYASPNYGNIVLQFSTFTTERCCDLLSIYNGSGLVNRYSGTDVPATIVLGSTSVVTFTTDGSVVSGGFSLWFSTSVASVTTLSPRDNCERQGNFYCASSDLCVAISQRCNGYSYCYYGEDEAGCPTVAPTATAVPSSCGGTVYGSGYVRSPNYPAFYDNYLRCNWTLIADPSYGNIVLQFLAFNTEQCCDFVSIYNSSGLVRQYSGTTVPATIVLGNRAIVSFITDGSVVNSGFTLWVTTFSVASVTTLSPRDNCERQGNFYCASSYLCVDISQRCNGYSYCYYGEDEAGCGTVAPTAAAAPSSCGGTIYESGYVRSPNYPAFYDNNVRCNWTLIANPSYGNIVLQFLAFNTEQCCDFVSIYNSSGLVRQYSGTSVPATIVLGNRAIVSFITDGSVVNSGFSLWVTTSVVSTTTLSPRVSCQQQGNFYCALSNLCVPSWRRCDGYAYCYYGEDEAGCSASSTIRTPSTTPPVRTICLALGNFYCEYSRQCISIWRRCDGYADCYYGEDESACGTTRTTSVPDTRRTSKQPAESFFDISGFAQAFLELRKTSASEISRGSWIVVCGCATTLLLGLPRFNLH